MENNMIKVSYKKQEKVNGKWADTVVYPVEEITFEVFERSFVVERWEGERRLNKKDTKFGCFHTKTITSFDGKTRSVREFEFPR